MKKLLFILLLSPLILADITEIDFILKCKVTEQVIIKSEDGIGKVFNGYEDGLEKNDTFNIFFKLQVIANNYKLDIASNKLEMNESLYKTSSSNLMLEDGLGFDVGSGYRPDHYITDNRISLDGEYSRTSFHRYFKNDWHMMNTESESVGSAQRTVVANCMNMPEKWDEMFNIIKEMGKDKWYEVGILSD